MRHSGASPAPTWGPHFDIDKVCVLWGEDGAEIASISGFMGEGDLVHHETPEHGTNTTETHPRGRQGGGITIDEYFRAVPFQRGAYELQCEAVRVSYHHNDEVHRHESHPTSRLFVRSRVAPRRGSAGAVPHLPHTSVPLRGITLAHGNVAWSETAKTTPTQHTFGHSGVMGLPAVLLSSLICALVGALFGPRAGVSRVKLASVSVGLVLAAWAIHRLGFVRYNGNMSGGGGFGDRSMFVQGWQSWSFTAAVGEGFTAPGFSVPAVLNRGFHKGGRPRMGTPATHTTSHWFTVVSAGRSGRDAATKPSEGYHAREGLVVGFLSQTQTLGTITGTPDGASISAHADLDGVALDAVVANNDGAGLETDWLVVEEWSTLPADPLAQFLQLVKHLAKVGGASSEIATRDLMRALELRSVAPAHDLAPVSSDSNAGGGKPARIGWCSWYHFFADVTEQSVRNNMKAIAALGQELPLKLVQIDDGFQTHWGDWRALKHAGDEGRGFVDMAKLARDIHKAGFEAGIWLAPAAADKDSALAKAHPDWILRDARGKPVNAGFCGKFYYALDVSHPDVLEFVARTVRVAAKQWGFTYLKLDFLHSPLVEPARRYDTSLTRAQVYHRFLRELRDAVGADVYLLGCGLPVGPGVGFFDAARVSADAGTQWMPMLNDKTNIPGGRNMLRNSVTRLALNGVVWANDPDCLLLRDTTQLTLPELQSIVTLVGLTQGPIIISDDLPKLSAARRRLGEAVLPVARVSNTKAIALDLLEREEPRVLYKPYHAIGTAETEASPGTIFNAAAGLTSWFQVAFINWGYFTDRREAVRFQLPMLPSSQLQGNNGTEFHCFEFWTHTYRRATLEECGRFGDSPPCALVDIAMPRGGVPSHGTLLFAFKEFSAQEPTFLGSDLHISGGLEVDATSWEYTRPGTGEGEHHALAFRVDVQRAAPGANLWVFLPGSEASRDEDVEVQVETEDGGPGSGSVACQSQAAGEAPGVWKLHLDVALGGARIRVDWR